MVDFRSEEGAVSDVGESVVYRTRAWAVVRAAGVGAVVAIGLSGCGSGSSSSAPSSGAGASALSAAVSSASSAVSSAASSAQQAVGLSGKWTGKYDGTFSGTFTLTWVQAGSKLAGKINLSTSGTVPVNGTVDGNAIKFGTVGSTAVKYTGTVSGDSMSGSYSTPSGGGDWSAHRAS
jgi:hypothetical protein